jgi:uncharacterized protein YdhG (YjbR/CyaY superfamily)
MENSKATTIDEFIAGFPAETQAILEKVRLTIRKIAPEATEKISYGIPTFDLEGNLVHFSGYQNHIGFYPGAGGIAAFQEEIAGYKSAKGSVQFPINKPIPYDLIERIVRVRVAQNLEKAGAKRRKKK